MRPDTAGTRKAGAGQRKLPASLGVGSIPSVSHMPMEWMDPMSWRLPSGKALAEFALQAGFLAPLILNGPRARRGVAAAAPSVPVRANNGLAHSALKSGQLGVTASSLKGSTEEAPAPPALRDRR